MPLLVLVVVGGTAVVLFIPVVELSEVEFIPDVELTGVVEFIPEVEFPLSVPLVPLVELEASKMTSNPLSLLASPTSVVF